MPVSLCIGATGDFEFIYDVLTHCIKASNILNVDAEKRTKWAEILDQIPPLQVGRHGQLQEWLEDYTEGEPSHRHATHLFAIFTGDQITVEDTPDLAKAAQVSLERRVAYGGGGTLTPGCGIWARLREGDLAEKYLRERNVRFSTGEGPPAGSAEIAEMLLQSHRDVIRLLPALPESWPDGRIKGLRARGAFDVDITWKEGNLAEATIHSKKGGLCSLRTAVPVKLKSPAPSGKIIVKDTSVIYDFTLKSGKRIEDYVFDFETKVGESYVIIPR